MANPDILGYNRTVNTANLPSGACFALDFGAGRVGLLRQSQITYQHTVSPQHEIGSNALYVVHGNPAGTLTCSSLVGDNGFLGVLDGSNAACGALQSVTASLENVNNCPRWTVSRNSVLSLSGVLPIRLTITASAGELVIGCGVEFFVGKVEASS